MTSMARLKDPMTSHKAARDLVGSGAHGNQKLVALRLVKKYPGSTYRFLYAKHQAECRRAGNELIFEDPVALMRRLSEIAIRRGTVYCPVSDRQVSQWWVR
jgi:hypothetical protein